MRQALANDILVLLRFSKDKAALQNGLNEIAHAFRAPLCFRGVKVFGGFNIPR